MSYVVTENNWLYDSISYKLKHIPLTLREADFTPVHLSDQDANIVRELIAMDIPFEVKQWIKQ